MKKQVELFSAILLLAMVAVVRGDVAGVKTVDQTKYTSQSFICDEKMIPSAKVNDDYCDCVDGTDEPGTSACENSKFWCENTGYLGKYIYSSRVNDGLCDCCDGSDENVNENVVACANTCWEEGEEYRKQQDAEKARREAGALKKQEYIESAKRIVEENKEKANILRTEVGGMETKLEAARTAKAAQEQLEQDETLLRQATGYNDLINALRLDEMSIEKMQMLVIDFARKVEKEHELVEMLRSSLGNENIPKEEESTTVAVGANGDSAEAPAGGESNFDISTLDIDNLSSDELLEAADRILADTQKTIDTAETGSNAEEAPAAEETEAAAEEETPEQKTRKLFDKHVDTGEHTHEGAVQARSEVTTLETDLESKKKALEALDDDDLSKYGPNLEFLALKDECFEKSFQGYKYSFCFFGNAKQDFNSLGNMNSLGEMEADGTMTVKFTDGARCWNGPARSLHVALQCGGENEMLDVYEPSVCEYHMKFTTPAVC
jgi:protein kinase C substrate 80K-H